MSFTANPETIDYPEARGSYRNLSEARTKAREDLEKQLEEKAQAEHDYRRALSLQLTKYREKGNGQGEAEIHAKADAAGYALRRDLADAKAKASQARLDQLEADRASLRQLVDWSMRVG